MSSGATYSPGAWFALVAPTVAILIDPNLPGAQLGELWELIQANAEIDEVLDTIDGPAGGGSTHVAFALVGIRKGQVRLAMRGEMQATVQNDMGNERVLRGTSSATVWQERLPATDVVWLVRPGGRADGVAMPIVRGAVLADVLAWQPSQEDVEQQRSAARRSPARPATPAERRAANRRGPGRAEAPRAVIQQAEAEYARPGFDEVPAEDRRVERNVERVSDRLDERVSEGKAAPAAPQVRPDVRPLPVRNSIDLRSPGSAVDNDQVGAALAGRAEFTGVDVVNGADRADGAGLTPDASRGQGRFSISASTASGWRAAAPSVAEPAAAANRREAARTALPGAAGRIGRAARVGRRAPEARESERRVPRLGSHARRRYGADDWSLPSPERLGDIDDLEVSRSPEPEPTSVRVPRPVSAPVQQQSAAPAAPQRRPAAAVAPSRDDVRSPHPQVPSRMDVPEVAGEGAALPRRPIAPEQFPAAQAPARETSLFEPRDGIKIGLSRAEASSAPNAFAPSMFDESDPLASPADLVVPVSHRPSVEPELSRPLPGEALQERALFEPVDLHEDRYIVDHAVDPVVDHVVAYGHGPYESVEQHVAEQYVAESYVAESYAAESYVAESYVADPYVDEQYAAEPYAAEVYERPERIGRHALGRPVSWMEETTASRSVAREPLASSDEPAAPPAPAPAPAEDLLDGGFEPDRVLDLNALGGAYVEPELGRMPARGAWAEPPDTLFQPDYSEPDLVAVPAELADPTAYLAIDVPAAPTPESRSFGVSTEDGPRGTVNGVLVLPDEQRVIVDGPVIIGRAPSQVDGDRPARLVTLRSAGRSISRNHVRIDVGLTGPFVVDLGSRNGTRLHQPGTAGLVMDPWVPYPISIGTVLVVADVMMTFVAEAEAIPAR